jgi:putative nucleotidyltransferase with HDIG domain
MGWLFPKRCFTLMLRFEKMEKRILVVDDEESIRQVARDFLESQGFQVEVAEDGLVGLQKIKEGHYDLLLSDIKMPKMDGLELVRRAQQSHPHLISILMTGYASLDSARVALQEGVYDYILKPFHLVELLQAAQKAFDRQRLIGENIRLKELAGLIEVSETINTTFRKRDLYQLVLKTALTRTGATRGSIMIYNERRGGLEIVASEGLPEHIVRTTLVKPGESIAGLVFQKGEPVIVSDISKNPGFAPLGRGYRDKSFISIPLQPDEELASLPLRAPRRILGVLNLSHKASEKKFTAPELEGLRILACQAAVSIENSFLFYDLEEAYLSAIQSLALLQEARDPYTSGHSQRVTQISLLIAKALNFDQKDIELLQQATMLHDIGKIGIPESILNKPGDLTPTELQIIHQHPIIGENVLKPVKFLEEVRPIIRHHHEREDGGGYPDGLPGKELSPSTKVLVVADTFDAMNSDRPNRRALSLAQIEEEFRKHRGTQFDIQVVDAFLKTLQTSSEKLPTKGKAQKPPDFLRGTPWARTYGAGQSAKTLPSENEDNIELEPEKKAATK